MADLSIGVCVKIRLGQVSTGLKVVSLLVTSQREKELSAGQLEAVRRVPTTLQLVRQCGQRKNCLVVLAVTKKTGTNCQYMVVLILVVGRIM